jgi:hypothetical protein
VLYDAEADFSSKRLQIKKGVFRVRITCNNEPGLSRHILSVSSTIIYGKEDDSDPFC